MVDVGFEEELMTGALPLVDPDELNGMLDFFFTDESAESLSVSPSFHSQSTSSISSSGSGSGSDSYDEGSLPDLPLAAPPLGPPKAATVPFVANTRPGPAAAVFRNAPSVTAVEPWATIGGSTHARARAPPHHHGAKKRTAEAMGGEDAWALEKRRRREARLRRNRASAARSRVRQKAARAQREKLLVELQSQVQKLQAEAARLKHENHALRTENQRLRLSHSRPPPKPPAAGAAAAPAVPAKAVALPRGKPHAHAHALTHAGHNAGITVFALVLGLALVVEQLPGGAIFGLGDDEGGWDCMGGGGCASYASQGRILMGRDGASDPSSPMGFPADYVTYLALSFLRLFALY